MIDRLPSLVKLVRQFQHVPYLASKNLYKVVHYFLEMDNKQIEDFCKILQEAKLNINKCTVCWCWKESQYACSLCSSSKRDQGIICVVESWQDLIALEKVGGYQGVYHVLGGYLSPLEGIGPEDLTIDYLIKRVNNNKPQELIFAFNQTPEGEATAAFIAHKLKDVPLKISCLARGLPVGSSLETMDRLTVHKALFERRPF